MKPARLLTGAVLGTVALAGTQPFTGAADAATYPGTFSAVAVADSIRVSLIVPSAPPSNTVLDLGGPSAQARLDHLGDSRAFASFPYPGETIVTGPGLARGASGIPIPGEYPLYAQSFHPAAPEAEVGTAPYHLKTESKEDTSRGSADIGYDLHDAGAVGHAHSGASTTSVEDAVTALAETRVTAFHAGPLTIGQIVSEARVEAGPEGELTREADTRVVGARVGETIVEITHDGIVLGPAEPLVLDQEALRATLAHAGVSVRILPKADTPSGVIAPTVEVTRDDPSGQKFIYRLGNAAASVDGVTVTDHDPFGSGFDSANPPEEVPATSPSPSTDEFAAVEGDIEAIPTVADGGSLARADTLADLTAYGPTDLDMTTGSVSATDIGTAVPSVGVGASPGRAARPAPASRTTPLNAHLAAQLVLTEGDVRPMVATVAGLLLATLGAVRFARRMESTR